MERTEMVVEGRTAPSPEVLERPVRRRFTVEYKLRILADPCQLDDLGIRSKRHVRLRYSRHTGSLP